jgi:hypothetical protein
VFPIDVKVVRQGLSCTEDIVDLLIEAIFELSVPTAEDVERVPSIIQQPKQIKKEAKKSSDLLLSNTL